MSKSRLYPGLNIQYPFSKLIMDGKKSVETRTYPIPEKYVGKRVALIETPGKTGNFKARIVAIIVFDSSFPYPSKDAFYKDIRRHQVSKKSPWAWKSKRKWGWPIRSVKKLHETVTPPANRGIIFTKACKI